MMASDNTMPAENASLAGTAAEPTVVTSAPQPTLPTSPPKTLHPGALEATQQAAQQESLEADSEEAHSDVTSIFDTESEDYTTSIASSVFDYKFENGRRYHAYREGEYLLPNDEKEQDRLDLHHHIFKLVQGGEIVTAPIQNPQRVLDMGTGTGIWAIDFADLYPTAEVLGIDLSPIQPSWVPPNCSFVVDDLESEWPYSESEAFDYIHGRVLSGSIAHWDKLFRRCYKHLKPGGYLEIQEHEGNIRADDDSMSKAKNVSFWTQETQRASLLYGKEMDVAAKIEKYMVDAGFQGVHDDKQKIPFGTWTKDPRLKRIGVYMRANMLEAVEPYTLAFLTRILGYSVEQAQTLFAAVRTELKDTSTHLYCIYHYVYGRKPEEHRPDSP